MRRLLFALLLAVPAAQAAVPRLLSHEGRLLRADGTPERSTTLLQFAIHDAAAAGAQVWSEQRSIVPSASGYYSLLLGEVTPLPTLDGAAYWLGVAVVGEAEMAPRTRLSSVPYALRAGAVDDTRTNVALAANGGVVTAVSGNFPTCGGGSTTGDWGARNVNDGDLRPNDPSAVWMDPCGTQSVTLTFDKVYAIEKVSLAGRYDLSQIDGQPERFVLEFSDGSLFTGQFPRDYTGMQTWNIRPVASSSIKYTTLTRMAAGNNGLRELEAYAKDSAQSLEERVRNYAWSTTSGNQDIPGDGVWRQLTVQPTVNLTTHGRPVRFFFHGNVDVNTGTQHGGCTYAVDGVRGATGTYGLGTIYFPGTTNDNHVLYDFSWVDSSIPPGPHAFTVWCINVQNIMTLPSQNDQGRGFFMAEEL